MCLHGGGLKISVMIPSLRTQNAGDCHLSLQVPQTWASREVWEHAHPKNFQKIILGFYKGQFLHFEISGLFGKPLHFWGGGGGTSILTGAEMLTVPLRGQNPGFCYRLGCSMQNTCICIHGTF